jgi:hypothetical protein
MPSKDEMETSFLIDGLDESVVDVYSCSNRWVGRIKKVADALGIEYTVPHEGAIRVTLPVRCLLFRVPPPKRELTEEQREVLRVRFKKNVLNTTELEEDNE